MVKKSKHSLYISDELFANFSDLAANQHVSLGRLFEMLYDQFIHDSVLKERKKDETIAQLKSLQNQIDQLAGQSEMLIQMANTLGIKFSFQQLIDTETSQSGMVKEAKQFIKAQRQSQILAQQNHSYTNLNN